MLEIINYFSLMTTLYLYYSQEFPNVNFIIKEIYFKRIKVFTLYQFLWKKYKLYLSELIHHFNQINSINQCLPYYYYFNKHIHSQLITVSIPL